MNIVYSWLDAAAAAQAQEALFNVMDACVAEGASIGFVSNAAEPMQRFWQKTVNSVANGEKALLVAWCDGVLVGTVLLVLDMPANGAHRAEIAKLLVHPAARRKGIARALLQQAEARAAQLGRRLLVLDTRTGDAAEPLYLQQGWQVAGQIPDYAQSVAGAFDATTVMFKTLPQR